MNVFSSIIALYFTDCNPFFEFFLLSLIILMSRRAFFSGFWHSFLGVIERDLAIFTWSLARFIPYFKGAGTRWTLYFLQIPLPCTRSNGKNGILPAFRGIFCGEIAKFYKNGATMYGFIAFTYAFYSVYAWWNCFSFYNFFEKSRNFYPCYPFFTKFR